MFADPLYQYLYAGNFESGWQPQIGVVRVFKAKHLMAAGAIEVHMVLGVRFIGAVMAAHSKPCNPIRAYDLMHQTRLLKIFQHTVKGDPVNFAEGGFQFGMRQCLTGAGKFFQHLHPCRGSFQALLSDMFRNVHPAKLLL